MPFGIQSRSDSFERSVRLTRRTATVTISARGGLERLLHERERSRTCRCRRSGARRNVRAAEDERVGRRGAKLAAGLRSSWVVVMARNPSLSALRVEDGERCRSGASSPTRTAAAERAPGARRGRAVASSPRRRPRRSPRRARRLELARASSPRAARRRALRQPRGAARRRAPARAGRGAPALVGREVRVARGEREAVRLADGLADDEASIGKSRSRDHPADHGDLLQILPAEVGGVGRTCRKSFATTVATPRKWPGRPRAFAARRRRRATSTAVEKSGG